MVYLFVVVDNVDHKTNHHESSKCEQVSAVKYIFNLAHWRELRLDDPTNQTSWCAVPNKLRLISTAICQAYKMGDCKRLPCKMIYASSSTLEDVKCMNDGRVLKSDNGVSMEHKSNLQCKRGFTLDLFLKKYDNSAYPSIIADPLTPITKELYIDVLNNNFRTCDNVDNYGTCGNNIRSLPEHIVEIQRSINRDLKNRGSYNWEAGKLTLSSEYLFTIAIENSLGYDYITEKLWHPLVAGSVPIYLGAPNVEDWLPCETNCIIDLRKFKTPKDAALYVKNIATNRTLYESYHQWRNEPVRKKFQDMLNYFQNIGDYSLDCMLCHMSNRVGQGENSTEIKRRLKTTIGHF
ncbi:unnamed protein product [Rotaria sordida]|nr:unnamed protein product [Rotaria sordida]CAF3965811.1 unnamed protein product [Rotaria sordida]